MRGTWLLVALPLLLAAFTVGRPEVLPPPLLPTTFDGPTATALATELAREYPDRSPGTAGAFGAAQWFVNQLDLYGFEAQRDPFRGEIPGRGRVHLQNLVAVAEGASQNAIVFLAHRDNAGFGAGAGDNASGTAALIELARTYAPVTGASGIQARPAHDLVFVSTDGGAYGALGAAHFAATSPYAEGAIAVVSLDAIGGSGLPRLLIGGDAPRSPAPTLVRTAAVRVLEETGAEPLRASAFRQLLDLGFPFTLGEQGPLVALGIPSLTLSTAGDDPPLKTEEAPLDADRFTELGRSAQGLLGSLDSGLEFAQGTTSYVYLGRRIVLGWAIQLVLIAALLPFLIGAVDLFARCRRRRIRLAPAVRNLRRRGAFWGFAGALFFAGVQLGLFADGVSGRPLPPHVPGVADPALLGLSILLALGLAGWFVSRERLLPTRSASLDESLAGYSATLLALGLVAILVVATNPFALVYLLPSLYGWLWLPQVHESTPVVRAALLAAGFGGPLLLVLSFAQRHDLGWEAPWYLLSLVATGYVPWVAVLLGLAWLTVAAQLTALAGGRYAADPGANGRSDRTLDVRTRLRGLLHGRQRGATDQADEALEA
ncbi:MAG: M28 family peptidase [Actinobacteria bacterium]|nr:M28 family peptidase [Actinomycetota bacterium]